MKILILHNRYQIPGGEEGVVQAEKALLEANGHQVALMEVTNDSITGLWGKLQAAASVVYSPTARQWVRQAIARFQPDIVHIHNFFPLLSPSVYDACREQGIPVVQTLHNYRLICPRAMPFRQGSICEACIGQPIPWQGVVHGCYRSSRTQSAAVATMLTWHRLRGTWEERVDAYIALTQFQKQKLLQAGFPADRIHVKPNFVFATDPLFQAIPREPFALFVGRLAEEKGVSLLLDAYRQGNLSLPLKIVGDGPLRQQLQQQASGLEQVSFLGQQPKTAVLDLMHRASFLVFPSLWYEGFPLTLAEAFSCHLPAVVPQLGSMAEIVSDRHNGLHFSANDATALAQTIAWATAHPDAMHQMGQNAYQTYLDCYTPTVNYQQLMAIYQSVMAAPQPQLVTT